MAAGTLKQLEMGIKQSQETECTRGLFLKSFSAVLRRARTVELRSRKPKLFQANSSKNAHVRRRGCDAMKSLGRTVYFCSFQRNCFYILPHNCLPARIPLCVHMHVYVPVSVGGRVVGLPPLTLTPPTSRTIKEIAVSLTHVLPTVAQTQSEQKNHFTDC